jgi:hypothetical protein
MRLASNIDPLGNMGEPRGHSAAFARAHLSRTRLIQENGVMLFDRNRHRHRRYAAAEADAGHNRHAGMTYGSRP